MAKPFQLGRGLGSLIPPRARPAEPLNYAGSSSAPQSSTEAGERVEQVNIGLIRPNPNQPRQHFDHAALEELVVSIKAHGIIQPLIVTRLTDGSYELVAGERRWRAAQVAELKTVPVIVRDVKKQESLEMALVENVQRQDLNPMEEAAAYLRLQDEFGLTQEEIARRVGRSRPQIANLLRLFKLSPEIQEALRQGQLTLGHAKVILSLETPVEQMRFFKQIESQGLSVHLAELQRQRVKVRGHARQSASPEIKSLEAELQRSLGTKVRIKQRGKQGVVELMFYSLEELAGLVRKMMGKE